MNYFKMFSIVLILFLLSCCNKNKVIHIFSLNKSQCITIINEGDFRYVINGKHHQIPKTGFIKLNVSQIGRLADALYICWQNRDYDWELTNQYAKIVESKLDTTKYKVNIDLPLDSLGIPTAKKFNNDSCAVFDFELMRLAPNRGAIVEY